MLGIKRFSILELRGVASDNILTMDFNPLKNTQLKKQEP
jgi:hypothetical protein